MTEAALPEEDTIHQLVIGEGEVIEDHYPKNSTLLPYDTFFVKTEGQATMPDLSGLSKREAIIFGDFAVVEITLEGDGYVSEQSVEAGEPIDEGGEINITLSSNDSNDEVDMMNFIFLILAFALTAILVPVTIPLLKRMKFGQSIRAEGPESHMAKTGTPTMGGLTYLIPTILLALAALFFVDDIYKMLVLIIVTVGFGLIGFIDDYIIVVKKDNTGLSSKQKFLAQIAVSIIVYIIMANWIPDITDSIHIPGTEWSIPLGFLF